MDLWLIFLTVVGGAFGIYMFCTRNFNHFKRLGIPYVEPRPIFGNMGGMVFKTRTMPDIVQESYDLNPDARYVGFYDFSSPVIILRDPELVKSITIKNFESFPDHKFFTVTSDEPLFRKNLIALKGAAWRDMRALLSPAFTASKMKMMFNMISRCAMDFADHLAGLSPQPEALDMKDALGRYTLNVIASTAFGLTVDSMKDRENNFYQMGKSVADLSGSKVMKFFIMKSCPWLANLLNVRLIDAEATGFFTKVIESTIATRDARGIVRPDMIQLMMQARDRKEKSALTPEDITAQALVFLLGGFDSPAATMSYAAQALALNPDVQRKLQSEIDQVLENGSGEVSYEGILAMKYLDAVVSESLRMFPPGPFMDRVGSKSFTLPPALPGLEPLRIEPGQSIWIPLYSFHHDPRYFPDPEVFDPERFSDENKSKISPLTYFPFGLGPRICIANRFALLETKLALFHLLSKCNLLPSSKTRSTFKLSPKTFLLSLEGGFWLRIEPRK